MPLCIPFCDKKQAVAGSVATVELRDDSDSSGWREIEINKLMREMEMAKEHGITGAMHLKSEGTYQHFCPGFSNMTLIGDSKPSPEYDLGHPRTYACLHLVQPKGIRRICADSPEKVITIPFTSIAKARYSAWWRNRDPRIWIRTNIGDGYFPDGSKGAGVEIAINFCVDLG